MATSSGGEVRGVERFTKTTKAAIRDLSDTVPEDLAAAEEIAEIAARNAPRRSGKLRRSGRVGKKKAAATVYFGSRGVPYAKPIHFGVDARSGQRGPHNIRANPFLNNAVAKVRPTIQRHYIPGIMHALGKIRGD
jgi:hypothetical protein